MTSQLAEGSARTYHLAPEGFAVARRRILRYSVFIYTPLLVFALVLIKKMFFGDASWTWLQSFVPAMVLLLLLGGVSIAGARKGIRRQREFWNSFELVIGQDFVLRKAKDYPEIEIQRDEVTSIVETAIGLFVKTHQRDKAIRIDRELVGYEDAKEQLSQWKVVGARRTAWWSPARLVALLVAPLVALFFGIFFLSKEPWLVVFTGASLLVLLFFSLWTMRKSAQFSATSKRNALLVLLPILFIAIKLMHTILQWP